MPALGSKALPLLALMLLILVNGDVAAHQDEDQERQTCQNTFFSSLVQLIPCRPAVAPFSPYHPSEACCSAVKGLGQPCLCVVVNGPPISGVDRNMAVLLPQKCTTNFEPCTSGRK
uniref:Bifunctional inhibitor/plant lipid transfer protein/seed storage helical domain-containing protein n=1 Tax=Kalanchoe fedtschenkoi TaxID=63787 RepID=A0A7N0TZI9_KALFE